MVGGIFSSMKMKRKDLEDVNDDFSDFSLSAPARKSRRLDVDLPPIMEEEEPENGAVVDHQYLAEEKEAMVDENQERAIVLFKHVNNRPLMLHSPCNFSVSVDSDLISGIKNQYPWPSCSGNTKSTKEEAIDNSMAVVPWVPSQLHFTQGTDLSQLHFTQGTDLSGAEAPDLMDAEQDGESAMEIEGNDAAETLLQNGLDGTRVNEGLHQWQQQHCLIPQLPFNTSTPIPWSR
ncbi:uncharacterized protein [Euphorbia lathyris]|uniref:uncharacterized protein n=1 Tax=Euphorbia lathyris TaxID=212925 RepID=UPI00331444FA